MNSTFNKLAATTALLLLSVNLDASAKNDEQVVISQAEVVRVETLPTYAASIDGTVPVAFTIDIPRGVIGSDKARVYRPVIENGDWSMELAPILVKGRTYDVVKNDQEKFDKEDLDGTAYLDTYVIPAKGLSIHYQVYVKFDPKMKGADIVVENETRSICRGKCICGHCGEIGITEVVYSGVLDYSNFFTFNQTMELGKAFEQVEVNEDFDNKSVFVINEAKFIPETFDAPFNALVDHVQRVIKECGTLDAVEFTVTASPDGPLAKNERLAKERTAKVKELVAERIPEFVADKITYNTISESWEPVIEAFKQHNLYDTQLQVIVGGEQDLDARERELYRTDYKREIIEIFKNLRNCSIYSKFTQRQYLTSNTDCAAPDVVAMGSDDFKLSLIEANYNNAKSTSSINNMMVAYVLQGDYQSAYKLYTQIPAEDLTPELANNKAVLLTFMGDYPMAEYYFGLAKGYKDADYNLALMYLYKGDFEKASDVFGKNYSANAVAANLAAGRYDDAAALTFGVDYSNGEAVYLRALAYSFTQKPSLVLQTLKQACDIDPIYKKYAENQAEFISLRGEQQFMDIVK